MSRPRLIVLTLALFAFAASLFVSTQVFENVPHLEDEVAYLFQAKIFARGQAVAPLEFPKSAFWQPFVIEHETGVRFSKYPPGWSMLLALGVLLGFPAVVNAGISAITVVLTYKLGHEAFDTETGVIAAALTAFSPMALLLNATLMAHTAALCWATLFMWAYLRMARAEGRRAWGWGALSGAALGMVVATRPLSAVAVGLPFIVWSGIAVLRATWVVVGQSGLQAAPTDYPEQIDAVVGTPYMASLRRQWISVAAPLIVLSIFALFLAALVPLYNAATTGDPRTDLYRIIWDYDRVGFGPEIGRNGHTLTKGVVFAQYDLSLTAADLFGWQASGWTDMLTGWVNGVAPAGMVADSYWPVLGLSWLLLPFGLYAGFRRDWALVWVILGALWLAIARVLLFNGLERWALFGIVWACSPLVVILYFTPHPPTPSSSRGEGEADVDSVVGTPYMASLQQETDSNPQSTTESQPFPLSPFPSALSTWLLFGVMFCLVAVHTAYWIGSQRYSTRYYAEGLSAAAILSALPLAWLMRRGKLWRVIVPVALVIALAWSYFGYSVPRISALRGYNRVTREVIDGVKARREDGRPVLVLVTGTDARWRTRAALWTLASPFLDSDIEVAFVDQNLPDARESILARLSGRQVIDMGADVHDVWFMDTCGESGCALANPPVNPSLLSPADAP